MEWINIIPKVKCGSKGMTWTPLLVQQKPIYNLQSTISFNLSLNFWACHMECPLAIQENPHMSLKNILRVMFELS